MATAGLSLVTSGLIHHRVGTVALLSAAMGSGAAASVVFFAWVTIVLHEEEHPVGIAVVNSIGHVGGFCGPYLYGLSSSEAAGLGMLGAPAIVAGGVLLLVHAGASWQPVATEAGPAGEAKEEPLLAGPHIART